ncbi:MAG: DEAD/DEAH box helicase [Candidatus Rokuibacteriota bacterium]
MTGLSAPVATWFARRFARPTEPQARGWPLIADGRDTLISAPTGSGKTLAAFLLVIDRLVRAGLRGELEDRLEAVYVSPLRALSHDIAKNLETPLAEIREEAARLGLPLPEIRAAVRTGDTGPAARAAMARRPPHILVTTPESLYLLLTSPRGRALLGTARTLIVDEIHALARDKRGSHLALSLARLDEACLEARPGSPRRPQRIGLSATQRPIDVLARFLVGPSGEAAVVDLGHQRDLDLGVLVPTKEDLQAVAPAEQWDDLLDVLADEIRAHRTTLVFTNTRRLTERVAHRLGERLGAERIAAHHGSLSRERRLRVEERLRAGDLAALVATASLELGIDIGAVDLVCQIGSPRGIATLLQRIGRSGHALGLTPKGRLFPATRDELVECAALVRAVRAGRLDRVEPPTAPLDVLAQQVVATCADREWPEDALFALARRATPYADLARADFDAVLEMLAQGFETPRGRRGAWLHRDRIQARVRGRRGARLAALTSGGAIPEVGDYRVLLDPDDTFIGTVNEDWAIESMAGDVFLLGTHSWRIRRVESGVVRVVDAQGAPPTLPFWLGEAPARTEELSEEVSGLRAAVAERLRRGVAAAAAWLEGECGLPGAAALQLARYIEAQVASTGFVPTRDDLLIERFFDEAGGMQLVIHSPYGARVNRGLGLALRKRLCASFNQELQAAATDDAIVLSLGSPQTFPLESVGRFLSARTVEEVLAQAFLASPLFAARWRWNATRSLAVLRAYGSRRVPFPVQRMQADDLLAAAFPEQVACQENVTYPIAIPEHPLVRQTVHDCLHEAADLPGLVRLLERIEAGEVRLHTLETVEPSPFAHEVLGAKPYAFLDDAPLEERRTRAVALRHLLPEAAQDLGRLDPEAIARVRDEARPVVRDSAELHEALHDWIVARPGDLDGEPGWLASLIADGRAAHVTGADGVRRAFAAERLAEVETLFPAGTVAPPIRLPSSLSRTVDRETAVDAAVRGQLGALGPVTAVDLAARLGVTADDVAASFARLETRGVALRGRFDPLLADAQACDRGLLARVHRYTLARLRREIEPVTARTFFAFLLRWQHVHPDAHLAGESGTLAAVERLAGFEAPAAAWESELLAARVDEYSADLLDRLCLGGEVAWGRLEPGGGEGTPQPSRATPVALFPRGQRDALLHAALARGPRDRAGLRGPASRVLDVLESRGALFAGELRAATGLLPSQLDEGLRELVARGLVACDGFASLRRLLGGPSRPSRRRPGRPRPAGPPGPEGRWGVLSPLGEAPDPDVLAEVTVQRLLARYGVVFRDLVAREWIACGWREAHRALRRLEARGQVRGGRFVTGFTGEQFALPEAVAALRAQRDRPPDGRETRVSAADPLNLVGILTPGPRIPAGHTRWLVVRDGLPIAVIERGRRRELAAASDDG